MQDFVNGRCGWCGTDELYVKYHDQEWGNLCFGSIFLKLFFNGRHCIIHSNRVFAKCVCYYIINLNERRG